eukprot:g2429.t1
MDATTPEGVKSIISALLEDIMLARPDDPYQFLIDSLTKADDKSDDDKVLKLRAVYTTYMKSINQGATPSNALKELRKAGIVAKSFPFHRRQVVDALLNSKDFESFSTKSLGALSVPGGPM